MPDVPPCRFQCLQAKKGIQVITMYRTYQIMISPCGKNRRLFRDLKKNLETSKIVYNQTLFYIRNLYTGLHKEAVLRTDNERKVISTITRYIQEINEKNQKKGRKPYPFPGRERASLSRNLLVMVMSRVFRDGYALDTAYAAKLLQNCVRQVWTNMDSFFRALSDYQKSPSKYQGRPRIPGYLKGRFFMLRYDRQMLKPVEGKKGFSLSFSKLQRSLYLGHLHPEKIREVSVKMRGDRIQLGLCYEDTEFDAGRNPGDASTSLEKDRILGIDPGVRNFAAVCNNFGRSPFVIKGGKLCAMNRYYNKERARLQADLKKNWNRFHSARLSRLDRFRYSYIQNYFHKAARLIVNYALEHRAGTIVFGHNAGWKQYADLYRKKTTQKFVSIPHDRFYRILKDKAERYGICVYSVEESYTSRASLLDSDSLPEYGKEESAPVFSGRRVRRGLYCSGTGELLNADVNGAGNIIRKYCDDSMPRDLRYLSRTTIRVEVEQVA